MAVKTFTTETLTSADTNTYLANSGLVYVTSATIGTTVSSVTVSGAFSSTYDNYLVTLGGGVSSAGCSLDLSLGSTTSGYKWCLVWTSWGATVFSDSSASAANMRYMGRSDTNGQDAHIDIMSPFLSKNTRVLGSAISNSDTGTTTGFLQNSTSYTAFTITPSGGTLTGGTITVYGYRKA